MNRICGKHYINTNGNINYNLRGRNFSHLPLKYSKVPLKKQKGTQDLKIVRVLLSFKASKCFSFVFRYLHFKYHHESVSIFCTVSGCICICNWGWAIGSSTLIQTSQTAPQILSFYPQLGIIVCNSTSCPFTRQKASWRSQVTSSAGDILPMVPCSLRGHHGRPVFPRMPSSGAVWWICISINLQGGNALLQPALWTSAAGPEHCRKATVPTD